MVSVRSNLGSCSNLSNYSELYHNTCPLSRGQPRLYANFKVRFKVQRTFPQSNLFRKRYYSATVIPSDRKERSSLP